LAYLFLKSGGEKRKEGGKKSKGKKVGKRREKGKGNLAR